MSVPAGMKTPEIESPPGWTSRGRSPGTPGEMRIASSMQALK